MAAIDVGNLTGARDEGSKRESVCGYDPIEGSAETVYVGVSV